MSGWAFLAIVTLVCAGVFANGVRFARVPDDWNPRFAPSRGLGAGTPGKQARRAGRLFLIAAPLMWVLFAAMLFGLFGPIRGLPLIRFT